jgi:DNA-binding LacI/PurR family transcriptional regulator
VDQQENGSGRRRNRKPALRRRVRLADVAKRADTSSPIASRILNRDPTLSVGDALRERVIRAAEELNYRPHAAARGLRVATTGLIGLLIPEITNTVFATIARGAFQRASERDYIVLLAEDIEEQQADATYPELVAAGRIDGLVIATARRGHPLLKELAAYDTPHVFLNRTVKGTNRNVIMDDARATRLAVDYLAELGHERVGHVAGPSGVEPATRRSRAFRAHAAKRGLDASPVQSADLLQTGGAQAASVLLSNDPGITAIYTSSVTQAAGVLSFAWHHGISVPEQLSVIAYADTPLAEALVPPLTAITMPLEKLGRAGVDMLLDQLEGAEPHNVTIRDDLRIVERASTAAPRSGKLRLTSHR